MKSLHFVHVLVAAGLVSLTSHAQEDVDPFDPELSKAPRALTREELHARLPRLIQVQLEWIEMDHATVTELLFLRDLKGDSTPLRKEVQELVRKDQAKILETAIVLCRPGQKATTESIEEQVYPTDYLPPEVPEEVELHAEATAGTGAQLIPPATPTAFETRNVGTTLEIAPMFSEEGGTIELQLAPEIVALAGESKWQTRKDALGNENGIKMPIFYSMRLSTGLTMRDGHYRFVGLHSPRSESGGLNRERKVMLFVKCDVIVIGEESLGGGNEAAP